MPTRTRALIIGFLTLATLAAYIGALRYGFVYDDPDQIVNNPAVHSWSRVPRYFTSDVWPHSTPDEVGNFYRPVFLLWLLLNYKIGSLNPTWYHLTTVALHLLATLLVYLLALRVTKDELVAAGGALLFGLHPVHLEAVAWISGGTEPLLAIFFIATFLAFLRSRDEMENQRRLRGPWLLASLGLYVLALLAKETAVVLPIIIFAYEWLFPQKRCEDSAIGLHERFWAALASCSLYLLLTAIYLIVRYLALNGLGHSLMPLQSSTIILTWPSIILFYVRLLVWPIGLSAFYDTPYVTSFSLRYVALPALIVAVIAIVLFLWSRRSSLIAFFSLWMLLPVLPLANLSVFKEGEIAHDRYLYLASIGFCVIVALAIKQISLESVKIFGQPAHQVLLFLVIAAFFGCATTYQSGFWASDETLSARGVAIAPNNFRAANNLGRGLAQKGNYDAAISIFRRVLEQRPDYSLTNFNLGYVYYRLERLSDAEHYLKKAIEINPKDPAAHRFLGYTLLEMGRLDQAVSALRQAITLAPNTPNVHYAIGTALEQKKDLKGALDEYRLELALNPNHRDASQAINQIQAATNSSVSERENH